MSNRIPTENGPNNANVRIYPQLEGVEKGDTFKLSLNDVTGTVVSVNKRRGYAHVSIPGEGTIRQPAYWFDSVEWIDN